LWLLQLLMRSPDRLGVHRHELHRALKRVSSTATAANVVDIITQCVYIKAPGQPSRLDLKNAPHSSNESMATLFQQHFTHALMARPSDTIGALKDKMMRIVGASGLSRDLRFHFAGVELQNERSLSQCGIALNDTLEMTLALSGEMPIFVKTLTGHIFTIDMNSSDSFNLLKIKMWVLTGIQPSEICLTNGRNLEYERPLSDYDIQRESTIYLILRLRGV
jgi:ubiquitin C